MIKAICLFFCLWFFVTPCKAQYDIELVTMGAGHAYYEAYGHSAIRVKSANQDFLYGFGYFNFNDENFFLNFAKGEMQYFLGIENTPIELDDYIGQGRNVWTQKLKLTTQQKIKLVKRLNFLARPENRYYHYDYFLSNCTTKIRDIIDEVVGGDIAKALKQIQTNHSWSDATFPAANQTWMNLGIAIAYGLPAYKKRTQWELSIFPEDFAKDLAQLKTESQWNGNLQNYYQPDEKEIESYHYNFFQTHYAVFLVVSVLMLGILFKFTRNITINFWLITQSLLGIGLLFLWFMTKHTVAAQNINVLLFVPFAFLLLFEKLNSKAFLVAFLVFSLVWLIAAMTLTNLYLIGFFLINVAVYWLKLQNIKISQ